MFLKFLNCFAISVEADPKTIRRCGKRNDIPNSADCRERLQEADKVLVCKCATDLCNGASMPRQIITTLVPPVIFVSLHTFGKL